jgi:hypothetical protein
MRTNVFISYSHKDEDWLQRLQVHLKSLDESRIVLPWDDTRTKPGQDWQHEIHEALKTAIAAVLLVSADFLASKFIRDNELPPLLDAAAEDGLTILSVFLKPCRFRQIPNLERIKAVNNPDRPMVNLSEGEREAVWVKTVDCIADAVRQSSPATRQEVALAQIQAEVRDHLQRSLFVKEMRQTADKFLHDPSLTTAERQEIPHEHNTMLRDQIISLLSEQMVDYQIKINTGSGSDAQRRHWGDLLQVIHYEFDRWFALRDTYRLDQALSEFGLQGLKLQKL